MSDTLIIEESEKPNGDRVAVIRTNRGEEIGINVDAAIKGLAELFSELDNEKRGGWALSARWYSRQIDGFRRAAEVRP